MPLSIAQKHSMANLMAKLTVEVAYALPNKQTLYSLVVESGMTVEQVIKHSSLLKEFSNLTLDSLEVGIFSKKTSLDTQVSNNDRIEVYRPLVVEPKEARRLRAKRQVP